MTDRALVNVESVIAVSVIAILLIRARPGAIPVRAERIPLFPSLAVLAALVCFVLLIYQEDLKNGFLIDDYTHLHDAGAATFKSLLNGFGRVPGQHLFYRPMPAIGYWIDLRWAALDSLRWHLWNLLVHAVNSFLVFRLLLLLNLKTASALAGGLCFALFAGSAEAVSWVDARTELTCAFLVLITLILMLADSKKPHWARLTLAMMSCALACCTKESAFAIPVLGAALAIPLEPSRRRNMLTRSLAISILCAGLFAYRWWALGGIGGYPTKLNLPRAAEGLLFRAWGFFFFPINWSAPLARFEVLALLLYLAALLFMVCRAQGSRPLILCAVAFAIGGLLPVYNMTLIGSDLAGSREFYVPAVGLAILTASLYSVPRMLAILLFQATMLHHNLRFWDETSRMASGVCRDTAALALKSSARIFVADLPIKRDGVPFLANGFPECVAFFAPGAKVEVGNGSDARGPIFVWDPTQNRLRPR
jgi:hypothetical protein